MATQSSTPLWLDLKIDYIDENFNKVFNYIHQNNIGTKDGFYDITINLLEQRIDALIQELQNKPIMYDESLVKDKEQVTFISRLLGLYLLSVDSSSANYRTALLLFVHTLALLEPKNISIEMVGNVLKFAICKLPTRCVLTWKDIEVFQPNIIAHKFNHAISEYNGYTQSDKFEYMGMLKLMAKQLQLSAANNIAISQPTVSLSILNNLIAIVTPKSDKLKQSKANDIESIRDFTAQFIADQHKAVKKLKRYAVGDKLVVRLTGKRNNHLQVVSISREYQQIEGEVQFSGKNFFFYKEQDFIDALNIDDTFDVLYLGDDLFEVKMPFIQWAKDYIFSENIVVGAKAVMITDKFIGWGTVNGLGVYTSKIEGVTQGDCAEIQLKSMPKDSDGNPTGWISGQFIQLIDEEIDYDSAKIQTISESFIYEQEEDDTKCSSSILSAEFVKSIYRMLIFCQQQCVSNPTERYKIISVCQMLATLIDKEQDINYIDFLAQCLEYLVYFAKGEYDKLKQPTLAIDNKPESVVRKQSIISIIQEYGSTKDTDFLSNIISNEQDELLIKLAILVQSCNRLTGVINRSMQNIIKREIISTLAVETEGDTDLEEENGIYLGIENDRQEFKTSFFHAPQGAKEQRQHINIFKGICAFLNTTDGGTLYIGVNDLGYIKGIDAEIAHLQTITYGNYKGVDGYMRYITDQAKQFFDIDIVTNIKTHPMYNNQVIAIEVTPYEFGIVRLENTAYLRVNGESIAISESTVQRIAARKSIPIHKADSTIGYLSNAIRNQKCVVLHNYHSANSGTIKDRTVEVFDFTDDGKYIWCYDLDKRAIRVFDIARIGYVENTQIAWKNQHLHKCGSIDIFNMTGSTAFNICLRLNLRAKNLLIDEFPKAEAFVIKENDNSWLLTTEVYNISGVARFYLGLANSIDIINAPELVEYVKTYCSTYLTKQIAD